MSKLKPFENKHNLTDTTRNEFKINNPNISLTVFDEINHIIYKPKNNSANKAQIVKIDNNKYAAIKPLKKSLLIQINN